MAPAKHNAPASNESPRRWSNWSAGVFGADSSSLCGFSASCVVGCRLNGATQPSEYRDGGRGNGCGEREAPTAEDGFPQSNGLWKGVGPIGSTHQFLEVACLGYFEWRGTAESAVPDEHGGITGGADDAEVHFTLPPLLAHHVHNAAHQNCPADQAQPPIQPTEGHGEEGGFGSGPSRVRNDPYDSYIQAAPHGRCEG